MGGDLSRRHQLHSRSARIMTEWNGSQTAAVTFSPAPKLHDAAFAVVCTLYIERTPETNTSMRRSCVWIEAVLPSRMNVNVRCSSRWTLTVHASSRGGALMRYGKRAWKGARRRMNEHDAVTTRTGLGDSANVIRRRAITFVGLIAAVCVSVSNADSIYKWEEYGSFVTSAQKVSALNDDAFGDNVSLFTGSVGFSVTDISVPGNSALPVAPGSALCDRIAQSREDARPRSGFQSRRLLRLGRGGAVHRGNVHDDLRMANAAAQRRRGAIHAHAQSLLRRECAVRWNGDRTEPRRCVERLQPSHPR